MREERKLKLKLKLTNAVKGAGSTPALRTTCGGGPNRQRQPRINLRLSLQAQHSPPIARSNAYGHRPLSCRFESGPRLFTAR